MKRTGCSTALAAALLLAITACSEQAVETTELRHYPIDGMDGVITRSGVAYDPDVTTDGNGSLRIAADQTTTVRLFETGDVDIEAARVIYRASLKTEDVDGRVYLEMWCSFPGMGEFFSRALQSPLSGTQGWSTQETPFLLESGQNPDNIKLNLVIDGTGTVWIDDLRLLAAAR